MFDFCAACEQRGGDQEIFDWCAHCERSLCPRCMAQGCCARTPARSGQAEHARRDEHRLEGAGRLDAFPEPDEAPLPEHFGGRCCARARATECSCAFHWVCPSHGAQHVGTHD